VILCDLFRLRIRTSSSECSVSNTSGLCAVLPSLYLNYAIQAIRS